jgi:O-antigen/teichoic acid export membrane protein
MTNVATQGSLRLVRSRLRTVFRFFTSQGITLVGNAAFGLLCVRLLPTSEYAKFVVLFGTLGSSVNLMDVGFSGSLIPLIGERVDDRALIANYVASLRWISYWLFALLGLTTIFAYPLLVKNRGWNWQIISAMVALLLVACWFIRMSATYGAVMILLRDRTNWYRGQMISSLGTLALLGVLRYFGLLTGLSAIVLNVSGMIFVGIFYFYCARRLLGKPGQATKDKRRAIIRLALPNVPYTIFYALQGQISLFLIIIFGHTSGVASVGALGRLSQLFAIFLQMNPMLVEPYFAKLPKERLAKNYLAAVSVAATGCIAVSIFASKFSGVFLWILGPKYIGLHERPSLDNSRCQTIRILDEQHSKYRAHSVRPSSFY